MARMARAPAMRLALSDTADREAFDAALDATPLGGVSETPVSPLSIDIRYCRHGRPVPAQPGPGSGRRQRANTGRSRVAWRTGQIDAMRSIRNIFSGTNPGRRTVPDGFTTCIWRQTRLERR